MKKKGWFVPVLVFFICILGLFLYQNNQNNNVLATTSTMPPILWQEDISRINKIVFKQGDTLISAVKSKESWSLELPIQGEADTVYLYNILADFASPKLSALADSSSKDPSIYGIDGYSKTLILFNEEGTRYEVVCGKSADEENYYVLINQDIYTLNKAYFDKISLNLSNWRNKNVLAFDRNEFAKIYVSADHKLHTLIAKEEENSRSWYCDTLDATSVSTILSFLESTRVKDFIIDAPSDLLMNTYGFNNPKAKFSLYNKDGTVTTLNLGTASKEDNLIYASLNGKKSIFTIPYFDTSLIKSNGTTANDNN